MDDRQQTRPLGSGDAVTLHHHAPVGPSAKAAGLLRELGAL